MERSPRGSAQLDAEMASISSSAAAFRRSQYSPLPNS
jgi:hypothetical protein